MSHKFILTIDGGGIRCMIPALILGELEQRMLRAGKTEGLHRYFDLMAGSGIGAMLVSALTFVHKQRGDGLPCTPAQILEAFQNDVHNMFMSVPDCQPGKGPFNAEVFEEYLKTRFGCQTQMTDALTRIIIPAYDILNRTPMLFSNFEPSTINFYLWQALRGACAAPSFFAPAMVENLAKARPRGTPLIPLINGGNLSHDPSLAAYVCASRLGWIGPDKRLDILSLGTGLDRRPLSYFNTFPTGNHGAAFTAVTPALINLPAEFDCPTPYQLNVLMNGDSNHYDGMATRVTTRNHKSLSYFRINGILEKASAEISDFSLANMQVLADEAKRFIENNTVLLDEIVDRLRLTDGDEQREAKEPSMAKASAANPAADRPAASPFNSVQQVSALSFAPGLGL